MGGEEGKERLEHRSVGKYESAHATQSIIEF